MAKKNKGFMFEKYLEKAYGWRRDGRPGHTDLWDGKRRIEAKFFTIEPATAKKNAAYNSAHGFEADKIRPLVEQLKNYCNKFDGFAIGWGEDPNAPDGVQIMSRKEAYEFLVLRLQNSREYGIRFCWGGKSLYSRLEGRYETLRKNGYVI